MTSENSRFFKECSKYCSNQFSKLGYKSCFLETTDTSLLERGKRHTHTLHLDKDRVYLDLDLDCDSIIIRYEISNLNNVDKVKNIIIKCCNEKYLQWDE